MCIENDSGHIYLNHLSSLELLNVAELASVADQFATLHIDNALLTEEMVFITNTWRHRTNQNYVYFSSLLIIVYLTPCTCGLITKTIKKT